jgi:hypothetical protein
MSEDKNRDNNPGKTPDSLENITNNGFSRRKFLGWLAAGTLWATGCTAPYFHNEDYDEKIHAEIIKYEYDGLDALAFNAENFGEIKGKATVQAYVNPQTLDVAANDKFKTLPGTENLEMSAVYDAIKKQNEQINKIFEGAKINRYIVHSMKLNADVDLFEQYKDMTKEDADKVADALKDLDVHLKNVSYEQRQKLKGLLAANKEAETLFAYNENNLNRLNRMCVALSDINSIEGKLDMVVDANRYSANILRSTKGINQYDYEEQGKKVLGEGRTVLNALLDQKLGRICSARSKIAQSYRDPEAKLAGVYEDIMKKIFERARDWDHEALHDITNDHLANALSMINEAYKRDALTKRQYQAAVRVVTKDALDKIGAAVPPERGVNVLNDVLVPAIPGYSIVAMFLNARRAFSKDSFSADGSTAEGKYDRDSVAGAKVLIYGNAIKNGFHNRENIAGSNSVSQVKFWSAAAGTAVTALGASLYIWQKGKSDSSSSSSSPGVTDALGGETGGPGF